MAPRRSVKSSTANNNNINYNNLSFNDVLCPICRSILIEPVTLPCNHGFCSSCFDGTVANANLVCPLCRVRIGSWLRRSSKKENKLINVDLWEAIRKNFPKQVQNKLEGIEEYAEEDAPRRLTVPGEIRHEYEVQKAKELHELHKQHEAEDKASQDYIKKLKEQEQYEKCVQEENLRLSEQVAKKLAQEYSFDPGPSSSKVTSKVNSSSCSFKKQLPIEGLLKNMSRKKLSVTVQPVLANAIATKEYTCKILCQDKKKEVENQNSSFDKANLLNWKVHNKLKKIVTEGEASDSNDSITSECRYFKPIDQRHIPLPMKIPIIKVPAIIATANTVIIGPPKGVTSFSHATVGSAFAMVSILAFPLLISQNETVTKKTEIIPQGRKISGSGNTCDTVVTEVLAPNKDLCKFIDMKSPKRQNRSKTQTLEIKTSPSIIKKYETRNRTSQNQKSPSKTPEKNRNSSQEIGCFITPSKRKRLRSTPTIEKPLSPKRTRPSVSSTVCSPLFHGFDNKNLNKLKAKTNGVIAIENANINNVNSKYSNSDIDKLRKLQEKEDFKYAQKLQEELNSGGRYSTRNSISVKTKNVKKTSTRQVTLKEMMSQAASKVP